VAADREGVQALLRSLSPPLAASVLIVLRDMMTEAAEAGRIGIDRLRRLEAGEPAPVKFTFPTHQQLTTLATEMGELGPAVWIMRGCGLRPCEMFGCPRQAGLSGWARIQRGKAARR
jgi:hypothetical protein